MKALIFSSLVICIFFSSPLAAAETNFDQAKEGMTEEDQKILLNKVKDEKLRKDLEGMMNYFKIKIRSTKESTDLDETERCIVLCGLIVLGIGAFALFFILALKNNELQEQSLKLFVIILLITGLLLTVVFKSKLDDLAPVIGLFGTIAGYILGKGKEPIK